MRFRLKQSILYTVTLFLFCVFAFSQWDRSSLTDEGAGTRLLSTLEHTKLSQHTYVVFAMIDFRNGNMDYPCVRLLVIRGMPRSAKCRFPSGIEVNASTYEMSENHAMSYGVYYLSCKIPPGEKGFDEIQLREVSSSSWTTVPMSYRIPDDKQTFKYDLEYSICVPFLFGEKYDGKRLVEFLELNKILGAQRVTIYVDRPLLKEEIDNTIEYYNMEGLLEIVQFSSPVEELWYHGQLVTITDCLNRYSGVSKYVAFHDLDEFLIPVKMSNLIGQLDALFTPKVGSIRVPTNYISTEDDAAPITLKTSKKEGNLDSRFTKCVLRPEMVFEQGIHHTSRVIQDDYLSPTHNGSQLHLYHYKNRNGRDSEDRIAKTYGKSLYSNYQRVVAHLGL